MKVDGIHACPERGARYRFRTSPSDESRVLSGHHARPARPWRVDQADGRYPLATVSVVLADTMCGAPPGFEDVMRAAVQFIEQNRMADIATTRITNAFSDAVDPVMRDYLIDQVARNDKGSYGRAAHAAFGFSAASRLAEITAPTLVVVGELDRVTPPPLSEDIAARIPGARLARIAGAGHISNLEQAAEFNRVVMEFLSGIAAQRTTEEKCKTGNREPGM